MAAAPTAFIPSPPSNGVHLGPLIALLQNSERRYDRALHAKVDALASGVALLLRCQAKRDISGLEHTLADLEAA